MRGRLNFMLLILVATATALLPLPSLIDGAKAKRAAVEAAAENLQEELNAIND